MTSTVRVTLLGMVTLSILSMTTQAHDFWIEPSTFTAATGAQVALRLYAGEDFKGESVVYIAPGVERFWAVDAHGEFPVQAISGDDPAGKLMIREQGLTVVGYQSKGTALSFAGIDEFEKYLNKEGLERHRELARKKTTIKPAISEIYSRHVKSLLRVTAKQGTTPADRELGLKLELIMEQSPSNTDPARLQLKYKDKPLADTLVVAFNKKDPTKKFKARSGTDGRVVLPLHDRGVWLITAVHMTPASILSSHDWESFWASLSFELPEK